MKNMFFRGSLKILKEAITTLNTLDRIKLFGSYLALLAIQFLDVVAIGLLGLLTSLILNSVGGNRELTLFNYPIDRWLDNLFFFPQDNSQLLIVYLGLIIVLFLVLKTITTLWVGLMIHNVLIKSGSQLSIEDLSKIGIMNPLKVRSFDIEISNYALTDGYRLAHAAFPNAIFMAILEFFYIFIIFLALIRIDFYAAIIVLIVFTGVAMFQRIYISRKLQNFSEMAVNEVMSVRRLWSAFNTAIVESWFGNRSKYFIDRIDNKIILIMNLNRKIYTLQQIPRAIIESVNILLVSSLVLVVSLSKSGIQTIEVIAVFGLASARLLPSLARLQGWISVLYSMAGGIGPYQKFRNSIVTKPANSNVGPTILKGDDVYSNPQSVLLLNQVLVDLRDDQNQLVFQLGPIDLDLSYGDVLCVFGKSGSGKTTFLESILGLREIRSGSMSWLGESNSDSLSHLRSKIAYIPQKPTFLEDTLEQNILFGLQSHNDTTMELHNLIDKIDLNQFVGIDKNLGSMIQKDGLNLSGGERQKLAIARALIGNPDVLVMDEATNAMDKQLEREIFQLLRTRMKGKLLIFITHNKDLIREEDKVLTLSQGN